MKNITLAIPDELLEKSKAYTELHGKSLNEFVVELLRRYVATSKKSPAEQLLERSNSLSVSTKNWRNNVS
ncbi:MAG: hypothetical protein GVY26_07365 [Bacteroidetes bacterium]|nr:hypothetical protein [Bacteroidota bacterium]